MATIACFYKFGEFCFWGIGLRSWKRKFTGIQFIGGLTLPPITACTVSTWAARWNSSTSPGRTWPTPGSNHTRSPCRRKKNKIEYYSWIRAVSAWCHQISRSLLCVVNPATSDEYFEHLQPGNFDDILYCRFGLLLSLLLTSYKSRICHAAVSLTGPYILQSEFSRNSDLVFPL
jgi:hypothetical protein